MYKYVYRINIFYNKLCPACNFSSTFVSKHILAVYKMMQTLLPNDVLGGKEFSLKSGWTNLANTKVVVPVSMWTDDVQPLTLKRWQPKFRKPFEQASAVV